MAVLQEDLDAYGLWTLCHDVQGLIEKALENVDRAEFHALHRLSEAVAAVADLRNVPAWRFPDSSSAQGLDTQLQSVKTPLQALIENPEASIKDEIEAHLVQISIHLLNCPAPAVSRQYAAELSELTEKYKEGVGNAIDRARQASTDAEDELQKVVEAKNKAIATLTDQLDDLKASIASEKADVSAQAARLDTALTTNNTAFTTKMTDWQNTWDEGLKDAKKLVDQQLLESAGRAEAHVDRLKDLEKQSRKLLEATARNSISTEYGTHAQQQNRAATIWSVCAVVLAVTGLAALFVMVNGISELTAPEAIWKSSVSALTLAIATYMGREASGHRKDARDAKRTQLDLNALEPFLANMDEDTAHDLREQFAKQIFSRPLANSKDHGGFAWLPGKESTVSGDKSKEPV
ncbi:MAG: hypothetical protein JWM59_5170 [Verrucomicrobiales bacterium]|nr:hypothetical protein [Verrucomicrobiales bacterium]